jgi:hypothetical protein
LEKTNTKKIKIKGQKEVFACGTKVSLGGTIRNVMPSIY